MFVAGLLVRAVCAASWIWASVRARAVVVPSLMEHGYTAAGRGQHLDLTTRLRIAGVEGSV
jgi:hypothetical protein